MPRLLCAAEMLLAVMLFPACQRTDRDVIPDLAPAEASAYAQDDATTDRVLLAYADLHRTLRESGGGDTRWEPKYYRLPAGSHWASVREQLDRQAASAGWEHDTGIAEPGRGYLRRAWTNGSRRIAAAYIEPPAAGQGATVLAVLAPRED